jgi:hypothetical protein
MTQAEATARYGEVHATRLFVEGIGKNAVPGQPPKPAMRAGDRVRRVKGGPEGLVLSVFLTVYGRQRWTARVRWAKTLTGGRRLGTGTTSIVSAMRCDQLITLAWGPAWPHTQETP